MLQNLAIQLIIQRDSVMEKLVHRSVCGTGVNPSSIVDASESFGCFPMKVQHKSLAPITIQDDVVEN